MAPRGRGVALQNRDSFGEGIWIIKQKAGNYCKSCLLCRATTIYCQALLYIRAVRQRQMTRWCGACYRRPARLPAVHDSAVGKLTRTTQAQFEEMAINHKVTGCQVLFRSGFELVLHVYTQSRHMVVMGTAALERQRCGV